MKQTLKEFNAEPLYPQRIYASQLITFDDLQKFKQQLLTELLTALKPHVNSAQRKWLKSHEIRRLLKISTGTLQTLKMNGTLPYTKMGGVHFYDADDVQKILETGKVNRV